jgi:hypothetical protein
MYVCISLLTKHPVTLKVFFTEFGEFLETSRNGNWSWLAILMFMLTHITTVMPWSFWTFFNLWFWCNTSTFLLMYREILTPEVDSILCHPPRRSRYLSDHCSVIFDLNISKPQFQKKRNIVSEDQSYWYICVYSRPVQIYTVLKPPNCSWFIS